MYSRIQFWKLVNRMHLGLFLSTLLSSITSYHQKGKKHWQQNYTWDWPVSGGRRKSRDGGHSVVFTGSGCLWVNVYFHGGSKYRGESYHTGNLYIFMMKRDKKVCASLYPFPLQKTHTSEDLLLTKSTARRSLGSCKQRSFKGKSLVPGFICR